MPADRNRKLEISTAPTNAKSREPACSERIAVVIDESDNKGMDKTIYW